MSTERVNVRALQHAAVSLLGTAGAAILERVYTAMDRYEAELRTELNQAEYERGFEDGFKGGYDAGREVILSPEQPVIRLPDESDTPHIEAVETLVAAATLDPTYYEGDSGDEDSPIRSGFTDRT